MDIMVPAEDGHWVNEKYARLAEVITDYDANMRLIWIPPENRTVYDLKPYAIIQTHPTTGHESFVFYVSEAEMDRPDLVLSRLFRGDTTKHDVLANLELDERAARALELKEKMEKAEERQDFIASVAKSPLHTYRHKGRIIPT